MRFDLPQLFLFGSRWVHFVSTQEDMERLAASGKEWYLQ